MVCFRQVLTAVSQDELRSVTVRVLQTLRHDTELYHINIIWIGITRTGFRCLGFEP